MFSSDLINTLPFLFWWELLFFFFFFFFFNQEWMLDFVEYFWQIRQLYDTDTSPQCPWCCGWDQTSSHGLRSPVEDKGRHSHSLKGRVPQPLPWQAFIAFLGTVHWGWSSFTMQRFALGGYRKQRRGCC